MKGKLLSVAFVVLLCVLAVAATVTYRIDPGVPNIEEHIMTLKEDVISIDARLDRMEKTLERIEANIDVLVERNKND